ncbi:DUF1015 domain-containing protein [Jeotgalibaca caeni]|uniref:DUF1015 domain-containing protein n=1 Tax=Jeotgalibaca caeni TaxID=3028623 RepID=UPI00237DE36A|nr:DUF1015 domain-containing protein [Jeotgalibaca caeni]MDE1548848.1 DUF1015 domain-containing protein [Jeotgalibaca caeni]
MVKIKPFRAIRPSSYNVDHVASPFYDVLSLEEAREIAYSNPKSFLHVERAEVSLAEQFVDDREKIFKQAKENLLTFIENKWLIQDHKEAYYLYRLHRENEYQYGLVATIAVDEYEKGNIAYEEPPEFERKFDVTGYLESSGAHTSPVILSSPRNEKLDQLLANFRATKFPVYMFESEDEEDDSNHCVWMIKEESLVKEITRIFQEEIGGLSIISGRHLFESAKEVAERRKEANLNANPNAEYNFFLGIIHANTDELVTWPLSGLFIHAFE